MPAIEMAAYQIMTKQYVIAGRKGKERIWAYVDEVMQASNLAESERRLIRPGWAFRGPDYYFSDNGHWTVLEMRND